MQEKETYTLRELYDNLEVPYAKIGKMADMSEGTVTRIRDGYPARRTTLNRLLRAFSEVYKVKLTLDNVTGVQIEDKHKHEQATSPPVSTQPIDAIPQTEVPQNRPTIAKEGKRTQAPKEKPKTRDYSQREEVPTHLADGSEVPEGTVSYHTFARKFAINERTFRDWIDKREIEAIIEVNPNRPREKYRLLTLSQQYKAVQWLEKKKPEMFIPIQEENNQ